MTPTWVTRHKSPWLSFLIVLTDSSIPSWHHRHPTPTFFLFFSLFCFLPTSVSQYTNAFAMTQLCGVLCAPWNGLIMDRHKGKPLNPGKSMTGVTCMCLQQSFFTHCFSTTFRPEGETEQEADLRSSCLSLFLTSLQCLLFSVCASLPVLPLQYLTFALQVLNRSFLYGGNAAFISIAWVVITHTPCCVVK